MTDEEIYEHLEGLSDRINHLADMSERVLVNHVAWLTSNQTILVVLLNRFLRDSDDPKTVLDQLEFEARSLIKNRTHFVENSKDSADLYRERTEEKIVQFFRDYAGTR